MAGDPSEGVQNWFILCAGLGTWSRKTSLASIDGAQNCESLRAKLSAISRLSLARSMANLWLVTTYDLGEFKLQMQQSKRR
jgi:hypothetical protein